MPVLAATYFQTSSLMYLAIALPLSLWIAQTHLPALSGVAGSIMAIVVFCFLANTVSGDVGDHVSQFIVGPFYHVGWQWSPAKALQSVVFHIGVPTLLCVVISAFWSDPR